MRKTLLALVVVAAFAMSANAAVVSTFTGADAGEGLDMQGNFVYAVDLAGAPSLFPAGYPTPTPVAYVIGDASFTDGADDQGFSTYGFACDSTVHFGAGPIYNFGSSDADVALKNILWSNMSTNHTDANGLDNWGTFSCELEAGTYKIQVLSAEAFGGPRPLSLDFGNDGVYDVTMDSSANGNIGMVATEIVTMAAAGTYTVRFGNDQYPNIPLVQGVTVEAVPEPVTMSLLALGAMGALIRRKK